ncbi:YwmB family TATA-box binding protein [Anaerosporobacter sp.]|uniref:YwmB family TATA-box binding protein n=1 Tax=Anaerosporobacter sp. TaxID=1872529 RepID=UPI00286ECA23|nr:YwmB family TATA-box binding protein [Anaerosporobacter sp.]
MNQYTEKAKGWIVEVLRDMKKIPRVMKRQNRKVRMIAYTAVVFWIAVLSQVVVNRYFTDDSKLVDAFTKANSVIMNSNLYVVTDMGTKFMSEEDEKNLLQYMSSEIGLTEECKITREEDSDTILTKKESDQATTVIKLIRNREKTKQGTYVVRRYLIVDITIKEDVNSILVYKKKTEKIIAKLDATTSESQVTFTGTYDGKLTIEERNNIANQFVRDLQANIVVEQRGDELYTIYAYTGLINDYVKSEGNKINVNIAFTYNEKKNKTNLYVATPILNQDY